MCDIRVHLYIKRPEHAKRHFEGEPVTVISELRLILPRVRTRYFIYYKVSRNRYYTRTVRCAAVLGGVLKKNV